ncbi:unnamed protein product [Dibothriocephalus latus]|uniref:Uncharacterized protein n=1 Tax=Dibothriocephalus latus TaxID=60516 RepID=A0A3P7PD71_DIBLA|nr:unnamed protein product [Dibothriocephalus latus]
MLVCYARELKEGFAPYCEEVLETMLPLLTLCLNDEKMIKHLVRLYRVEEQITDPLRL